MKVRLRRKLADFLDGVDVSHVREGDIIDLSEREAALLILEGWATRVDSAITGGADSSQANDPAPRREVVDHLHERLVAADHTRRSVRTLEQLRRVRDDLNRQQLDEQARRRREDAIREDLRDSRAITIGNGND
jgi:hypothetical protein